MKKVSPAKKLFQLLTFTATLAAGTESLAAVISHVGTQTNVETFSDDADGWRSSSPVKTFDIDGDDVIGTDGWDFAGSSPVANLPSYISSSTINGGHNDNNRGLVDNPLDAGGLDLGLGWTGNSGSSGTFGSIVFDTALLTSDTVRLSILYDSNWSLAWGTQTFTLIQTVGGSDSATTETLTLAGDGLDITSFDISGIQTGDTFEIRFTDVSINWAQIGGIAFDTPNPQPVVPEPATASLVMISFILLNGVRRFKTLVTLRQ